MRVAILCNGKDLALWQRRAVEHIAHDHELVVLACAEPTPPRRNFRHLAYYALNLFTVRNRLTKRVPFPDARIAIAVRLDIQPIVEGHWTELPDAALSWLKAQRIDVVVKFGLGLLRVPSANALSIPILSFHHGDPRAYRGRPAGFWELANGAQSVGQVVQILSNRLDAGRVVAFAESRAFAHSYRRTLVEAYALSPYLLPVALRALASGETIDIEPNGPNHRLPTAWTVLRFVLARWAALVRWLGYGALIEKQWRVAIAHHVGGSDPLLALRDAQGAQWEVPALSPPYLFYADPFFDPASDDIIIEALHRWSGKGQLVRLKDGRVEALGSAGGHVSYPAPISQDGNHYLVPEVSEWSRPGIYQIEAGRLQRVADLNIGDQRLIDPTLFRHADTLYLFANTLADGVNVLHLWTAKGLFDRFQRHPMSPIRLSVRGSRMAGNIIATGGALYRLGQDVRRAYGDGLLAFKITDISPSSYQEELVGDVAFNGIHGPHTANFRGDRMLFDFYRERLSLFAGMRRICSKF